jgi:hypothetical protein
MTLPVSSRSRRLLFGAGFVVVFAALTALTQIGGVVLVMAAMLARRFQWRGWRLGGLFCGLYLIATFQLVPAIAPLLGRVALPCNGAAGEKYRAQSAFYCITNRNYVQSKVKEALSRIADSMAKRYPGTVVTYLDANFPFADGFPLPPHLSHKDGRKLDLALYYRDRDTAGAWFLGYWAFPDATGFVSPCKQDGFFRWNMAWLQPFLPQYELHDQRTRALIEAVLAEAPQKVLVEPHLVRRLHLDHPAIMFAGCHAARHDDHIHVQWP